VLTSDVRDEPSEGRQLLSRGQERYTLVQTRHDAFGVRRVIHPTTRYEFIEGHDFSLMGPRDLRPDINPLD
jgi:hypothetical protein